MWWIAIFWFLTVGNDLAVNNDYDYTTNTFRPKVVQRQQVETNRSNITRAPTFYKY